MPRKHSFRPVFLTVVIGATIIAIGLAIGLAVGLHRDCDDDDVIGAQSPSAFKSAHGSYPYAAVASDHKICSNIGTDIMARLRGSAIDAGIATLLCIGAMCSHSGGVGGGSFAVLYHKQTNKWLAVDFRESAPSGATEKMFAKEEDRLKSVLGGLSIGVPGELRGALEMHARFGTVPWKSLVMPTVKLLRDGFPLPKATWKALKALDKLPDKTGFEMFLDAENNSKPMGSIIKMPKLAKTFQKIADDPYSFYNGSLAGDIVNDVKQAGGIITLDDLSSYRARMKEPVQVDLPGNKTMFSMPPPGSGAVLAYILSILSGYKMSPDSIADDDSTILAYHRIVEAMKFAYAKRSALGDEDFVDVKSLVQNLTSRSYGEDTRRRIDDTKTQNISYYHPYFYNIEDSGTSHLNAMDGEGNAISITSTVNHYFGSKVVGDRTGIFFNNEMDDFSTPGVANYFGIPPSTANFIRPGKRPMSSMCPALVWDHHEARVCLATGAAGGSKITTATALAIIDTLWYNMSVVEATDWDRFHHQFMPNTLAIIDTMWYNMSVVAATDLARFHHQLMPNTIAVEDFFPQQIKAGLEAKGHTFSSTRGTSVVQTLALLRDQIEAAADFRKGGTPSGF